jgi:hypothetical protein
VTELAEALRAADGVRMCDAAPRSAIDLRVPALPAVHLSCLESVNGFSAANGYFRLFGLSCASCRDAAWWNRDETWKFAWRHRASSFWCFGETGWGDQYAYDLNDLSAGRDRVFLLDAFEMEPEIIAGSFEEFVEREVFRQVDRPYDSMTRLAMERIGALGWDELVTYVPSPLLGGPESIDNVVKLPARALMVWNGDLAVQLSGEPDREVERVEAFEDESGRSRLRVVWA